VQVLGQMTLDEKITMVHGTAAAGYTGLDTQLAA
jgi:hypothetical protein